MVAWRFACVLLACGLLTGCFDMDMGLTAQSDGTATIKTRMAMEAGLMRMAGQQSSDNKFCAPNESLKPEGVLIEHERFAEGSMEVCVITASGPIDSFAEWFEKRGYAPAEASEEASKGSDISLQRDGSDYVFRVHIENDRPASAENEEPMVQAMKTAMLAGLAGRSLDWSVTAPVIRETSGRLTDDGKTAKFSIPLATLLDEGGRVHSFEVRFALGSPSLFERLFGK